MITNFETLVREHWQDWVGGACPDPLSVVQRGGTLWEESRVLFLALDGTGRPALFARAMRDPRFDRCLEAETELLAAMSANPRLEGCVPVPVWTGRLGGQLVAIERSAAAPALVGRRPGFGTGFGLARGFSENFARAAELLGSLGDETREPVSEAVFREALLGPLRAVHVDSGRDPARFDELANTLVSEFGAPLFRVVVHGDTTPKNFLARDGHCVLIDWETATRNGLPLIDLFYFASRYAWLGAFRHHGARADRVSAFWATDSKARRQVFDEAAKACKRLGLSEKVLPPLFRLHFLHKAWLKHRMRGPQARLTRTWLGLYDRHMGAEVPV